MEHGLQVYTEEGSIVQLDSNYTNFRLSRRIRVVGAYNSPKLFTCLPDHLYAVSCAKYGERAAIIPKHVKVNGLLRQAYAVYGEVFLYEFTASKRNPSLSGLGMELYAEDGSVNYSSNDYNLKVTDYRSGNLTNTPINSTIYSSGYINDGSANTPGLLFVLGLIPIRYTGQKFEVSSRLGRFTDFYQVSTLFFSKNVSAYGYGMYTVSYMPFYWKDPATLETAELANNWQNSSSVYSYLVIDTSLWSSGLPPIELYQ